MQEILSNLGEDTGQAGLEELGEAVAGVLGAPGPGGRNIRTDQLKAGVYRLHVNGGGDARSLIAKRLDPDIAHRNRLVADRWLPTLHLGHCGPILLAVAAERAGACVWHVYEDLGHRTLKDVDHDEDYVQAAVQAIAGIHAGFADHPLLGECRLWGGDLGPHFFRSNVHDAIRALAGLEPPAVSLTAEQAALRDRLRRTLGRLADEEPARSARVRELGGPETLVHGDLWTKNVIVIDTSEGPRVRLIDWDHAAVGHVSYDLSTFLTRFARGTRSGVVERYRRAMEEAGCELPEAAELNELFDTAERGRIANRVIWPALAIRDGNADWAFDALAEIESWFETLEPVLEV
jgi:hypothetical protein